MSRILILIACALLGACASTDAPRPRLVTSTNTVEVPVLKFVPVPSEYTDQLPTPPAAALDSTWLDPVTGASEPAPSIGGITDELDAYREALAICYGHRAAVRALKPPTKESNQ